MDTDDEDVDVDAYLDSLEAEEATACAAQPRSAVGQTPKEAPRACFHIVKSILETQVLHMTLPREGMTPREVAEMWTEWGVPHAQRIKFKLLRASQCLQPHLDSLPLAPNVVLLEGKGSVLLALEGACRKRSVQMESLRSGEAFSWPSWTPEQVLEDHHRKMSEEQMTRWREEGRQKPPAPPPDEPRARVPLIDPYAPASCYPAPPPESRRLPVEPPQPQASASPAVPSRESFPQAKPAVSPVKAMPKVAVSAKPAKAEPAKAEPAKAAAGESWSSKQQRLKKEQREARLAENLRRRAARGGDEEVKNGRPSLHEDAVLHAAENSQDPQSSRFPVEEKTGQTSKAGGGVDMGPKEEAEIDLQGVPLRVLRSKQRGSGLLSWGKP